MKFQDSSFNGLKVTVGTKSVTHPPTHAPKTICPINFFKVGGIIITTRLAAHKKLVTFAQIPHPIHRSSDIKAILSFGVTSIHNFPVK